MAFQDVNGKYVRIERFDINYQNNTIRIRCNRYRSKEQRDTFKVERHNVIEDEFITFDLDEIGRLDSLENKVKNLLKEKIGLYFYKQDPELIDQEKSILEGDVHKIVTVDPWLLDTPFFELYRLTYVSQVHSTDPSILQAFVNNYTDREARNRVVIDKDQSHDKPQRYKPVIAIGDDGVPQDDISILLEQLYALLKTSDCYKDMNDHV